ncbi:MAG TPA: lamin tail domain-containing protein [Candidatus Paceibacterota bacterium]
MLRKLAKSATVFCFLLAAPVMVYGQVKFSEIMYDIEGADTGREWIEVQNTGDSGIDLTAWKLFEANSNHKISAIGDAILPALGYAIITDNPEKFKADNPQFSGLLYDSAFSLSNDGETIVLRNESSVDSDTVSYTPDMGALGDGTSLQKISSGWISAVPTPGSLTTATESYHPTTLDNDSGNQGSTTTSDNSSDQGNATDSNSTRLSDYSAHSAQAAATVSYDIPEFQVTAGRARLGFVGTPIFFEAKIKAAKNLLSGGLGAEWSMGDGTEKAGQTIYHTYQFAGDYVVILNAQLGGSSAVSKIQVKIVDPSVEIVSSPAGYIEISNASDNELNIGGWILETVGARSILPRDILIQSKSSIKIPVGVIGMREQREYVRLANPSGKIVAITGAASMVGETLIILPDGIDSSDIISRLEGVIVK